MINLLPDSHKAEIRAGRTNVLLVRYIAIMTCAVVVLGGLVGGSYVVLNTTRDAAQVKVSENALRVSSYQDIQTQANAFRSDLATAKTVLDSDVSFAKLIYRIANIVPKGVVLDNLSLDPKSFGSSGTMNASAKTYNDATKLKDAFVNNSDIFSNVQFQTLRFSDASSANSESYPVKVNLTVTINKGALE